MSEKYPEALNIAIEFFEAREKLIGMEHLGTLASVCQVYCLPNTGVLFEQAKSWYIRC